MLRFFNAIGHPNFLLTFSMDPHWTEYPVVKRDDETFGDSTMAAVILKTKLSALRRFIQRYEIIGKVSAFVWRIEYQKRGLPHAHVLFWIDIPIQNFGTVESAMNVRYPKDSPVLNTKAWSRIFDN
jgi:hypothetical protein